MSGRDVYYDVNSRFTSFSVEHDSDINSRRAISTPASVTESSDPPGLFSIGGQYRGALQARFLASLLCTFTPNDPLRRIPAVDSPRAFMSLKRAVMPAEDVVTV